MKKTHIYRAMVVAGLAIAPVAATTSASALSFVATQGTGERSTANVIGLPVENAAGDKLGDINYLVLDSAGKISTVVIGVGGFLGVGEKNVGIPFNELSFADKDGRRVAMIDATKESLTNAPKYTWTEKSATNTD
ncbi:MAG: PRC-barrel domain-containing protein [Proteobacteria bacterium]|nr:PRC-barrel domain-containing protein [Pseudomonadota bacterium]